MREEYNGWKNRETWALSLYINNDQGLQEMATEAVTNAFNESTKMVTELEDYDAVAAICAGRDVLQEWTESLFTNEGYKDNFGESMPDSLRQIAEDIGSLWRIDYYEVAEGLLAAVAHEFVTELEQVSA